jgi:hypothetical protein
MPSRATVPQCEECDSHWMTSAGDVHEMIPPIGMTIPPIFSSSYILVEVYAAEADDDEEESESEGEDSDSDVEEGDETSVLEGEMTSLTHAVVAEQNAAIVTAHLTRQCLGIVS